MNPAPPSPAEQGQAGAVAHRPAGNGIRRAGRWLTLAALGVLAAGFAVYRWLLGDGQDGYGILFFPVAAVTAAFAVPLGLVGATLWLVGVARSGRAGS